MRAVVFVGCLMLVRVLSSAPVTGWVCTNGDAGFTVMSAESDSPVLTDADADTIAANLESAVTLADGESITLSGSVRFDVALKQGQFRIGLFAGPNPVLSGDGSGFEGYFIHSEAWYRSPDSSNPLSTSQGAAEKIGELTIDGTAPPADTELFFELTLARAGSEIDLHGEISTASGYQASLSVDGLDQVEAGSFQFNAVALLMGNDLNASEASYSMIDVSLNEAPVAVDPADPPDPGVPQNFDEAIRILGVDFNCSDALNMPTQSRCRVIQGSASTVANPNSYRKTINGVDVWVVQPSAQAFEFHGANADTSREIPGGDLSRAYLVADFIGTRAGRLQLQFEQLPAGDYLFRSFHLDTLNVGANLGFAQGVSALAANTLIVAMYGTDLDLVHPTAIGTSGLNTTFIADSDVPTIEFSFSHDGNGVVQIDYRATKSADGVDYYLLMNGFELYRVLE